MKSINMTNKNISTEIIIHARKEKVWDILTNFSNYPNWNPFIISVKGKLEANKRLTNTMLNGKKTFVIKPKVLSVVPYKYFAWIGSLFIRGIFDGHHHFKIEEISPNQVKLTQGEDFSGIFSSLILKKIGEDTRNNFIKMNEALKQLAEKKQV